MQREIGRVDGWQIVRNADGFAVSDGERLVSGPHATHDEALAAALRLPQRHAESTEPSQHDNAAAIYGGANPPQHLVGDYGEPPPAAARRTQAVPSGSGTALAPDRDVADPHPSNEEFYDRERHPGGANPPRSPAPNDRIHPGTASPRGNAAAGPTEVPTQGDERPMGGTNRLSGFSGLGIGLAIAALVIVLLAIVLTFATGQPGPQL